ncbi:MAG: acyltransferase family protein [Lachnospiraceae bacterium]|nr:acyltransferase family protein [Lachnospiraceae bacterium]
MEVIKKRDDSLDAVKGFAILIVMLGHCIVLNGLSDPYFYDMIVAIQMPLFMIVSGYLMGNTPLELNKKPDLVLCIKRIGKRSISYLVPFFAWLILTHLTNPLEELKLQLFALDRGLWFLMILWIVTLVMSVASYFADYIAYYCKGNQIIRFVVLILILGICYLLFILQARSGNQLLSPSLTVKYLPYYVVGYMWSLYLVPLLAGHTKKIYGIANLFGILAACGFVFLVVFFDMIVAIDVKTLLAQMIASFLGSFVCFYGVYQFAKGKLQKVLAFIGQFTLEIYVLHFRFARLLGIGQKEVAVGSPEAIGWILMAFIVMSVLTAICIWVIKKIWFLDFLLFGKYNYRK